MAQSPWETSHHCSAQESLSILWNLKIYILIGANNTMYMYQVFNIDYKYMCQVFNIDYKYMCQVCNTDYKYICQIFNIYYKYMLYYWLNKLLYEDI
jgi:hypothetical protein